MKHTHIIFIPPDGQFKKQDFSLHRIAKWMSARKQIKTTLLYIKSKDKDTQVEIFDNIIEVSNKEEILAKLKMLSHDIIFNRGWMHSYSFSKELVQQFDNVVINIKDWNFSSKEEYQFLFNDSKDFEALEYIVKHAKYILSHYTDEQASIWSQKYFIDKSKFVFFPEYCNKSTFIDKKLIYKDIKIAYAGKIHKSCYPEQLFSAKSHLRSIKKLTKQGINIDFILPKKEYEQVISNKDLFIDFLYENRFNKKFNLLKGKALSPIVLKNCHFGFFELETSGENKLLYEHAIVSKFAFYLESCTPMLINKDFVAISNLVSTYKLGIVFSNKDLDNFNAMLKISQNEYNQLIENIKQFRKNFTYEANQKTLSKIF